MSSETTSSALTTGRNPSDINTGDELPMFELPVTSTVIVAGAIASRDFMPAHHDAEYARSQGAPDLFMNILTTQGICSRYVTDWAGPDAVVTRVQTKLGGPNMPGDVLKIRGKVVAAEGDSADVEVTGNNAWGNHVTATFSLRLPA